MYTGVDLLNSIRFRTYSGAAGGYLNIDRVNELVRSGRVKILEDDWRKIVTQSSKDEISPLIKLSKDFIPNNNRVLFKPLVIASAKVTVVDTYIQITFDRPHNLPLLFFNLGLTLSSPLIISGLNGLMETGQDASLNKEWTEYITYVNDYTIQVDVQGTGYNTQPLNTTVTGKGQMTSEAWVSDYYHLLSISHTYEETYNHVKVLNVNNNSKLTEITTTYNNNFRTGQAIKGVGFTGLTAPTFDCYVMKTDENKIRLFTDVNLTVPYIVAGSWISGGVLSVEDTTYADPNNSDQNIDNYNSTAYFPLYKLGENSVTIDTYILYTNTPSTNITEKIFTLDYISELPSINLEDNVYDIYQIHNANFYDRLIEYCALKFQAITSSGEDVQITETIGGFKE